MWLLLVCLGSVLFFHTENYNFGTNLEGCWVYTQSSWGKDEMMPRKLECKVIWCRRRNTKAKSISRKLEHCRIYLLGENKSCEKIKSWKDRWSVTNERQQGCMMIIQDCMMNNIWLHDEHLVGLYGIRIVSQIDLFSRLYPTMANKILSLQPCCLVISFL